MCSAAASRTSRRRRWQSGWACAQSCSRITSPAPRTAQRPCAKWFPAIEVFGDIDLNRAVGGINPDAVEWMARMSGRYGKVVWLPTIDADNHMKTFHEPGAGRRRQSMAGDIHPVVRIARLAVEDAPQPERARARSRARRQQPQRCRSRIREGLAAPRRDAHAPARSARGPRATGPPARASPSGAASRSASNARQRKRLRLTADALDHQRQRAAGRGAQRNAHHRQPLGSIRRRPAPARR